jgi:DNA-directed RNA polymerase specialized sigma subunit
VTLADRIADYLAGTGRALTAREIAKELHVRHADVLHVLERDMRFYRWPSQTRRKPYGVRDESELGQDASEVRERSGAAQERSAA